MVAYMAGYEHNAWATVRQWNLVGCKVIKDEQSTPALFWKRFTKKVVDEETGEEREETRSMARTFNVFNLAQVEVVDEEKFAKAVIPDPIEVDDEATPDIEECKEWFAPIPADFKVGSPAYSPRNDVVFMPKLSDFEAPEYFYGTLAHELTHWTGHKSRLDRPKHDQWGDDAYAFEELIAELGAVFVCNELGIEHETREDHVAYLASWASRFEDKPQSLWTAATKASDAFDLLKSF